MMPTGPLKCAALTSDFGDSRAPTIHKVLVAASLTCDHGVGWLKTTRPQSLPRSIGPLGLFAVEEGTGNSIGSIWPLRFTLRVIDFPAFSLRKGTISSRLKIGFPFTATI